MGVITAMIYQSMFQAVILTLQSLTVTEVAWDITVNSQGMLQDSSPF